MTDDDIRSSSRYKSQRADRGSKPLRDQERAGVAYDRTLEGENGYSERRFFDAAYGFMITGAVPRPPRHRLERDSGGDRDDVD